MLCCNATKAPVPARNMQTPSISPSRSFTIVRHQNPVPSAAPWMLSGRSLDAPRMPSACVPLQPLPPNRSHQCVSNVGFSPPSLALAFTGHCPYCDRRTFVLRRSMSIRPPIRSPSNHQSPLRHSSLLYLSCSLTVSKVKRLTSSHFTAYKCVSTRQLLIQAAASRRGRVPRAPATTIVLKPFQSGSARQGCSQTLA